MTNRKTVSTMADRVAAQLKFELDFSTGLSAAEQGAILDAYMAVRFPPRKSLLPPLSPGFYSVLATVAAVVAPVLSLAGIMFAGLAL